MQEERCSAPEPAAGRPGFFPSTLRPDSKGLVAVGGDLSPAVLLEAYTRGIFPWYSQPFIAWYAPDPRFVLTLEAFHLPRSLGRVLRAERFAITLNQSFREVVQHCADTPRVHEDSTWITPDMVEAYVRLHHLGRAHSVEAWRDGVLAGGLYGVSVGRIFCGESMFALESDASKAAFATFVDWLREAGFGWVDCQSPSGHLARFGARNLPRGEYQRILQQYADDPAPTAALLERGHA